MPYRYYALPLWGYLYLDIKRATVEWEDIPIGSVVAGGELKFKEGSSIPPIEEFIVSREDDDNLEVLITVVAPVGYELTRDDYLSIDSLINGD